MKKKRNIWSDNFRPYGTYTGKRGNPTEWANAFAERMTPEQIIEILGADDPWSILGIKPGATQAEIKKAFRKKAVETHPDKNPGLDGSAFRKVKAAFDKLT